MTDEEIREAQLMLDAVTAFRGAIGRNMRTEIIKRFCELTNLEYTDEPPIKKQPKAEEETIARELEFFIQERCDVGGGKNCRCRDFYNAFVDWCLQRGVKPPSKIFANAVLRKIRPFTNYRSDCDYKWQGVTLKKEFLR